MVETMPELLKESPGNRYSGVSMSLAASIMERIRNSTRTTIKEKIVSPQTSGSILRNAATCNPEPRNRFRPGHETYPLYANSLL